MKNILPDTDGGLITTDNAAVAFIDHQPHRCIGRRQPSKNQKKVTRGQ